MNLIEMVKEGAKFAKNAGNSEMMQTLIDVQQQILDIQQENLALQSENERLKKELDTKNANQVIEKTLLTYKGFIFQKRSDAEIFGPFCQSCWHKENYLSNIILKVTYRNQLDKYVCPSCGFSYGKEIPNSEDVIQQINYNVRLGLS